MSAVVITLNAARSLDACLGSVRFADEIVVVDSGSTDETRDIALRHRARVIHREWLGYGSQKQFAVEQATHSWVLCIDADEQVTDELRGSIERALGRGRYAGSAEERTATAGAPPACAYEVCRCNKFMGRWLRHGEGYPDWILRLFDRRHAHWSDDPVHEKVVSEGAVVRLQGDLLHDSAETLRSYLEKQARYTTLQANELTVRGVVRNALSAVLSPATRFLKFYILRGGFLDGVPGFVHIAVGSLFSGAKYVKALVGPCKKLRR